MCRCQIPQALGALDGTHIPIIAPSVEGKADYYSRKQCYAISTQATVGANLVFLDVATGFSGSCHNSKNLRNTYLFRRTENRKILAQLENVVENSQIRPLLLVDSAYPVLPRLIKPFQFGPALTSSERNFNGKLSSARVKVERAFGILKALWRYWVKRLENRIENVSAIIITCCVLHNICQMNKDDYIDRDGILEETLRQERDARKRNRSNHEANPDTDVIRSSLKQHIMNNM